MRWTWCLAVRTHPDARPRRRIGATLRSVNQMGLMFRWVIDDVAKQVQQLQPTLSALPMATSNSTVASEQSAAAAADCVVHGQMIGALQQNADTSRQASSVATQARHSATEGGDAVSDVIRTMNDITGSSHRIADITGVIDGIAFQTNILAFECVGGSGPAGEQGKTGLPLVAGEVRQLAQRTAHAAREIKSLIAASVET